MPHDKYKAQAWIGGAWKNVKSSIFCMPVELQNGKTISDCNMHIENTIYPASFGYLKITYDPTAIYKPGTFYRVNYVRELTDGSLLRFETDEDIGYYVGFTFR